MFRKAFPTLIAKPDILVDLMKVQYNILETSNCKWNFATTCYFLGQAICNKLQIPKLLFKADRTFLSNTLHAFEMAVPESPTRKIVAALDFCKNRSIEWWPWVCILCSKIIPWTTDDEVNWKCDHLWMPTEMHKYPFIARHQPQCSLNTQNEMGGGYTGSLREQNTGAFSTL